MKRKMLLLGLSILMALILAGCVWVGGHNGDFHGYGYGHYGYYGHPHSEWYHGPRPPQHH